MDRSQHHDITQPNQDDSLITPTPAAAACATATAAAARGQGRKGSFVASGNSSRMASDATAAATTDDVNGLGPWPSSSNSRVFGSRATSADPDPAAAAAAGGGSGVGGGTGGEGLVSRRSGGRVLGFGRKLSAAAAARLASQSMVWEGGGGRDSPAAAAGGGGGDGGGGGFGVEDFLAGSIVGGEVVTVEQVAMKARAGVVRAEGQQGVQQQQQQQQQVIQSRLGMPQRGRGNAPRAAAAASGSGGGDDDVNPYEKLVDPTVAKKGHYIIPKEVRERVQPLTRYPVEQKDEEKEDEEDVADGKAAAATATARGTAVAAAGTAAAGGASDGGGGGVLDGGSGSASTPQLPASVREQLLKSAPQLSLDAHQWLVGPEALLNSRMALEVYNHWGPVDADATVPRER